MGISKALFVIQLVFAGFLFLPVLHAADLVDQSGNLFAFQQKLAARGNAQAQYTVAFMYETGYGVAADTEKAKAWYQQAADKGSAPAAYRLTYLKVREKGFDKAQDKAWLSEVKSEAFASKPEAMFLLGQLYHEGIGVKKDLRKSLDIMYRLGTEGLVAADGEIERIEAEILASKYSKKKKRQAAMKKPPVAKAVEAASSTASVAATKAVTETKSQEDARALKRKKYEAVMLQLAREQAEIDKLQGWAEGREMASIDDEI